MTLNIELLELPIHGVKLHILNSNDLVILFYTGRLVKVAKKSLFYLGLANICYPFGAVKFKNGKPDLSGLKFVQKVIEIEKINASVQKFEEIISRGSRSGAEEGEEVQQDRTNDSHPQNVSYAPSAIRGGCITDRDMLNLLCRIIPTLCLMAILDRHFSQVIADIEDESESIQLKDAVAWAETEKNMYKWAKQRCELMLSISDFFDELIKEKIYPRCCYLMDFFPKKSSKIKAFYQKIEELRDSLARIDCLPKTSKSRSKIAPEIKEINALLRKFKESIERYLGRTTSQGSSSGAQGEEDNQRGHTNEGGEEDNQQGHTNDSDPQATPNTSLPETERVKAENVEFEIIKSKENLCHGTFGSVCVSFIQHEDIEGAQLNNSLLRRQSGAQFVHPQMVINKPNIWLVVEKIDSTLEQFIRNDRGGICSSLRRIFIRDILNGFIQLERRGYTADLKPHNIAIVNGRAKFMRLSNSSGKSVALQRQRLKDLFEFILGKAGNNVELTNFYAILKSHPTMCLLAALRDHPLLLTCQKRIQFLVFALVLLKFKIPEWRCLYDREYQLDVQQRKKVEGPVPWLKKFKGDPNYKEIVENPNASYSASPSSEAVFARNAIVHINDGKIRKTVEQVDKDLSAFLPNMLIVFMTFLFAMNIDVWDRYNKKNGEDFFSEWQATLKLCMPENDDNDVVTEYFIKICRYFFAVIANHQLHIASKGEAVSKLLTSIEGNILIVEKKFFKNEMKYGKLVPIIEDEDVVKTYRSSIKFLKRFLEFVHLVLEKYVQDPDRDVSMIFQDAVKKFNAPRRDQKQQKELLKHVPTGNQFKLLLNNPKNVKDCGTITTKLFDNLIHRLSSILGQKV